MSRNSVSNTSLNLSFPPYLLSFPHLTAHLSSTAERSMSLVFTLWSLCDFHVYDRPAPKKQNKTHWEKKGTFYCYFFLVRYVDNRVNKVGCAQSPKRPKEWKEEMTKGKVRKTDAWKKQNIACPPSTWWVKKNANLFQFNVHKKQLRSTHLLFSPHTRVFEGHSPVEALYVNSSWCVHEWTTLHATDSGLSLGELG